jgi:hypothetical protein
MMQESRATGAFFPRITVGTRFVSDIEMFRQLAFLCAISPREATISP